VPKIVDVRAKRSEILSAAAEVFARHGHRGTSLQRVAARAGMGKSSLYHYFPTREALLAALATEFLRHESQIFATIADGPGPAVDRLRRLIDAITGLLDGWKSVGPLLIDLLREPVGRRRMRETFRVARTALAKLVRDGQREGSFARANADGLAALLLACLDGLFLQEIVEAGSTRSVKLDLLQRAAQAIAETGGRKQ
jgi:AcrR family transcriptional regulator